MIAMLRSWRAAVMVRCGMETAHCTKRRPGTTKLFAKSGIYAYHAQHSADPPVTVDPQTGSPVARPRVDPVADKTPLAAFEFAAWTGTRALASGPRQEPQTDEQYPELYRARPQPGDSPCRC